MACPLVRPLVAAVALVCLVAPHATAAAQWRGPRPPPREIDRGGVRFRLPPPEGRPRPRVGVLAEVAAGFGERRSSLGGDSSRYEVVSPLFRIYGRVAEQWALAADYGFVAATDTGGVASGNLFVSAHHLVDAGDGTLRVGLGVTAPMAGGTLDTDGVLEANLAMATRLGYDAYLWTPRGLAVILPSRIETYTGVLFAAEFSAGAVWSLGDDDRETEASGFFQIVGELAGSIGDVDLGVRVGATYLYALTPYVEPFARAHVGPAVVIVRGSLPLVDTGTSVAAGLWGLHVGLGAELPDG